MPLYRDVSADPWFYPTITCTTNTLINLTSLPYSSGQVWRATAAIMLQLSPYRNPPYRTPTPKGKSISPPPGPSPKRKRTDSGSGAPALQITTTSHAPDIVAETPAASPRSKVAERLQDLDLAQVQPIVSDAQQRGESPRKRLRRNTRPQGPSAQAEFERFSTPEPSSQPVVHSREASPLEIGETPDWRSRVPSSPPPPLSPRIEPLMEPTFGQHNDSPAGTGAKRLLSPPPPNPQPPDVAQNSDQMQTISSSATSEAESSIDRSQLTWQDDEITGQDIDTSPDDDGEGINGIGFRPTPATAFARSQRRKQQVNEWKAREAREARQRRFERRRGGASNGSKGDLAARRTVRFDGVG